MKLSKHIRNNLRFLVAEVGSQISNLQAYLDSPSASVARRILDRSGYAYNLMLRIHDSCHHQVIKAGESGTETASLRTIESIATDLEHITGLCRECIQQLDQMQNRRCPGAGDCKFMLGRISSGLDRIEDAIRRNDTRLALKIGRIKPRMDKASQKLVKKYTAGLKCKKHTEDLVAGLFLVHGSEVNLDLERQRLLFQDQDLCQLDALMVKKISARYSPNTLDRLELLRVAEQAGVRVFSRAENILRLIDRLSCTVTLRNAAIPMPATRVTEDIGAAITAVQDFGSAVFKPLYSTKARGMCVIDAHRDHGEIEREIRAFQAENPMMYIQQKIELPGRDLGMVFLDGEYLGSYARVSKDSAWNTTIHSGGKYAAHTPPDEVIELARRAQGLFDMDFTTVDVAETRDGPIVFEVSAFGGFRGALEGIGIDAAGLYTEHVLRQLMK